MFGVLRSCYEAPARFKVGGPVSTIRWFFAPEGAAVYTAPNIFFPLSQTLQYKPVDGVGEMGVNSFPWRRGVAPWSVDGEAVHGTEQDFLGLTEYTGPAPWEDVPACRVPNVLCLGGERTMPRRAESVIRFGGERTFERAGAIALGGYSTFTYYAAPALALGAYRPDAEHSPAIALGGYSTVIEEPATPSFAAILALGGISATSFSGAVAIALGGASVVESEPTLEFSGVLALGGVGASHADYSGGVALTGQSDVRPTFRFTGGVALGGSCILQHRKTTTPVVSLGGNAELATPEFEVSIAFAGVDEIVGDGCTLCEGFERTETVTVEIECPDVPDIDGATVSLTWFDTGEAACSYYGTGTPPSGGVLSGFVKEPLMFPGHVGCEVSWTTPDDDEWLFQNGTTDTFACDPLEFAVTSAVYLNGVLQEFTATLGVTAP